MDSSEMNVSNGIVALSNDEIALVSGGKATEPPKTWWEKMMDWAAGLGSRPSSGGQTIALTGDNLVALQQACVSSGRDFHFETSTAQGSLSVRVADGSGSYSYMDIDCVRD